MAKMLKKNNRKKLMLAILLLAIIGGAGAYAGYRMHRERQTRSWRAQGIAAALAGDNAKAADLLARYLQRQPADVEALERFIIAREQVELPGGRHLAATISALRDLLREKPNRLQDRRHLLELYMKIDRRPEALDTANIILAQDPRDYHTLELKTQVLARLGQYREALDVADKWTTLAPGAASHMARLQLRLRMEHPRQDVLNDARGLRVELEKLPSGKAQYELVMGAVCALASDNARSEAARAGGRGVASDRAAAVRQEAAQLRQDAEKWLNAAAADTRPGDDFAGMLVTQFDRLELNKESLALLESWVTGGAAGFGFRNLLARRYWEAGEWEKIGATLGGANPADPRMDTTLIALNAIALVNLKKNPEAVSWRAALAGRNHPVARAWTTILSQIIDSAPVENKEIRSQCEAALIREPGNVYLRFYYGEVLGRLGENDLAVEAWNRVVLEDLTWSTPVVRLAGSMLARGQAQQAWELSQTAARRNPRDASAVVMLARAGAAYLESGRCSREEKEFLTDKLPKLVSDVQSKLPGEDRSLVIQIQLLAEEGHKDQALALARSSIVRQPAPDEAFYLSMAAISERFGFHIEEECFSDCQKAHGITSSLAYYRALHEAGAGRTAEGLKVFDGNAQRSGKAAELPWRLARAQYLDIIQDPAAKSAWVELGDAYPKEPAAQQAAAAALAVRGDWDFMGRTIDRLKALDGENGLAWQLARGRLMVDWPRSEADYTEGAKLLNGIVQKHPLLPEPRVLLSKALVRMNRIDGAIDQLAMAQQLDPESVSISLRLAALLQSRGGTGDADRAQKVLDGISSNIQNVQQRRQTALLMARQGRADQAIQRLEESSAQDGATRPDLLLAVLYGQTNQLDKAEAVVKKLMEKPDLATIQFAAALYASQGRPQEAAKALAALDSLTLEPGIKELVLGGYCSRWGDASEAVKHCRAACQQAPANSSTWRTLADFLAAGGHIAEVLTAVDDGLRAVPADKELAAIQQQKDLLKAVAADQASLPALREFIHDPTHATAALEQLRAVVELSRTGDMGHFVDAIHQLRDRFPDDLATHLRLARACFEIGRTGEAVAAAQAATARFSANPQVAATLCQYAAAAARWDDMLAAAGIWRSRSWGSPLGADLAAAQAQIGLARYDAALATLKPYLAQAIHSAAAATQAVAGDAETLQAQVLAESATALIGAGRVAEASDMLWPLVAKSPLWRQRWAQLAAGYVDKQQAGAWLDRLTGVIPAGHADELAGLAEAWESAGKRLGDPAMIDRAALIFRQVVDDPAAGGSALADAGRYAEANGDLALAEKRYRLALQRDSGVVVAQNNLAMLIITRGGDPKEALALASSAVARQPRSSSFQDTLAQVQHRCGDLPASINSMRLALKLDPDNPTRGVRLAEYLFDGGQVSEAYRLVDTISPALIRDKAVQQRLDALLKRLHAAPVSPHK